jgi:hypothetical protein
MNELDPEMQNELVIYMNSEMDLYRAVYIIEGGPSSVLIYRILLATPASPTHK